MEKKNAGIKGIFSQTETSENIKKSADRVVLVWKQFQDRFHPAISVTNENIWREYERFRFINEQKRLNSIRCGFNLVDERRSRHILEGKPVSRSVRSDGAFDENGLATTVIGWSGGHANPEAARFGKTQIPDYWTGERFMFEVSDILTDANSHWYRQEVEEEFPGYVPRFVCVEKRYGVPIRVVAEREEDGYRCVTAFPDYEPFEADERLRVVENERKKE